MIDDNYPKRHAGSSKLKQLRIKNEE